MFIKTCQEKDKFQWDSFLIANQGSFLQSFEWANIQEAAGKKTFFYQAEEGADFLCQALVLKEPLRFGKYFFYIPFGPCFKRDLSEADKIKALDLIIAELKKQAGAESAIFLQIEPMSEVVPQTFDVASRESLGFIHIQPGQTWLLDLTKTEQEIKKGFAYRVRYNINLAERKGIAIKFFDEYKSDFFALLKKTSQRKHFRGFSENHYQNLFRWQSNNFQTKTAVAEYQGKIIAAYILVFWRDVCYCLHGASDEGFRALKAPNLLQWEIIKFAKRMGSKIYDFWGYDEKKWPGVSAFKKSFGGYKYEYPKRQTLVFKRFWFFAYRVLKKIKNIV